MPARSNFDYTNRTSSGERLGASIASDFLKKAAQVVKPAKTPSRPSKTKPKSKSTVATHDDVEPLSKQASQNKLDIKIPNKSLTDAGVIQIADALTQALVARSDLVLTDLVLCGNEVTSASLIALTQVVRHTKDLTHLDLSNNKISINDKPAQDAWESFAGACVACPSLARLDLSGNRELGYAALEALSRLSHSSAGVLSRDSQHSRDASLADDSVQGDENTRSSPDCLKPEPDQPGTLSQTGSHTSASSPASTKTWQTQPYLVIAVKNTDLDERGSLFLSALMQSKTLATPHRVECDDNVKSLGKDGAHLMKVTQALQDARDCLQQYNAAQAAHSTAQEDSDPGDLPDGDEEDANVVEEEPDFDEDAMLIAVDRAMKKVQRNVIIEHGYNTIELWTAAMKVFVVSRKIYALAAGCQWRMCLLRPAMTEQATPEPSPPKKPVQATTVWGTSIANVNTKVKAGTPFEMPVRTLKVVQSHGSQQNGAGTRSTSNGKFYKHKENRAPLAGLGQSAKQIPRKRPEYLSWQERHLKSLQSLHGGASNGFRDTSLKCHLPLPVCKRILTLSTDDRTLQLLTERQQAKAIEWGQLHDSLRTEHDWRNKDKASQVWMLLEALDCLHYEIAQ